MTQAICRHCADQIVSGFSRDGVWFCSKRCSRSHDEDMRQIAKKIGKRTHASMDKAALCHACGATCPNTWQKNPYGYVRQGDKVFCNDDCASKHDQATADFFAPPEEQRTLFQEGVVKEGWIDAIPEAPAAPLYTPKEPPPVVAHCPRWMSQAFNMENLEESGLLMIHDPPTVDGEPVPGRCL